MPKFGQCIRRQEHYRLREAAWLLGVEPAVVARAVRVGVLRATRRRGGLTIAASELARVLPPPVDGDPPHPRRSAMPGRLLARVPAAALAVAVRRDGACMGTGAASEPGWLSERQTDDELAAELCAGCPVAGECLELEFREAGTATVGVWGGLPADVRRELYAAWLHIETADMEGGPQE